MYTQETARLLIEDFLTVFKNTIYTPQATLSTLAANMTKMHIYSYNEWLTREKKTEK